MSWNSIMGFISTVTLVLPIACIIALGLWKYRSFPALLVYCFSVFVYNLFTEGYIRADPSVIQNWGLINNVIDAPLMLYFLTYFSMSAAFTKRMHILILGFLVFEAAIITWKGLNIDAITIIMGPGLLSVIGYSLFFFIRQTKIAITHQKAPGKAVIASSLIFAYGCYGILYLMYYVLKTPYVEHTFLIYFLVTTISSLILTTGILIENKRVQKLLELKVARKELSALYSETKKTTPLRTVFLDFDKENYN